MVAITISLHYSSAVRRLFNASTISGPPWTQPRDLDSYQPLVIKSLIESENVTEIIACVTSVTIGSVIRQILSVAGCLVNTNIHLSKFHLHSVLLCNALLYILPGDEIPILMRASEPLNTAIAAPVNSTKYFRILGVPHDLYYITT